MEGAMSMAIWRCQREWEIVIIGMQHTGWAYDMGQRARERRTCTMAAIRGVRECGLYGLSRFTHCGHASQRTRRERATRGPGWRSRRVGTSTDHADRCTARSSLQLTTPRSLSECVLKLRASCGLALALRRDGICSLEGHQGPKPLAINCHPLVESRWQIVWQRDIGDLMPLRPPPEPLCSPVPTQAKPKQAVLPRQSQTPTAGQA
jgi:hypothetical protein